MFKCRSQEKEILDNFSLSGKNLSKNLRSFSMVNRFLGGHSAVSNALSELLKKNFRSINQNILIADLGCGGGDTLRFIAEWFKRKSLPCQLVGFDANQSCVDYSIKNSLNYNNIFFQTGDILAIDFQQYNFDIIMINTVCHHFTDEQMISLLKRLKNQSAAMIVNDLHRHWLAYYSIKFLTYILPCSPLEKNDGPLSVLKAFTRKELELILKKADIHNYQIKWRWAFRYQVLILNGF